MKELSHRGLSAAALKLLAIAAMFIDHFTWLFLPLYSPMGQLLHALGRTTIPIMCFFIAEGYHKTHSIKQYAVRLGIFALAAQLPYTYFRTGEWESFGSAFQMNVIFTLLCSLLAVWVWDTKGHTPAGRVYLFLLCLVASVGDWSYFAVLFTLAFATNRGNPSRQRLFFAVAAVFTAAFLAYSTAVQPNAPFWGGFFQFGLLLSLPLLRLYNGQRGGAAGMKWVFYLFYPLHLLVLALVYYRILA